MPSQRDTRLTAARHFCLVLLFVSSGCVRTAIVKFWEPAEIDVTNIQRVAVMDFSGEAGQTIAVNLSRRLWENDFYNVIDRVEFGGEVQMAAFTTGRTPRLADVLPPAQAQRVDGIILGDVVEYQCEDEIVRDYFLRFRNNRENPAPANHRREELHRTATVTIAFRLVDVQSGEIRATREVSRHFDQHFPADAESIPTKTDILESLSEQCLDEIVAMLAPHENTSRIELARCDIWMHGRREVKEGIELAAQGNWEAAEQKWRDALEQDESNHAALFNLAVAADQRQLYDAAEELAMQALRLQHRDHYALGLQTIRTHRNAHQKFQDQRDAQLITAGEANWRT